MIYKKILLLAITLAFISCGEQSDKSSNNNIKNSVQKEDVFSLPNLDGLESPTKNIKHIKKD